MNSKDLIVLYEDNHLIVVNKPAGILVQGDDSGEESLMDVVKSYIKEKYQKPGNVFLGLVHRLDRNVSGVVLFAKTSKGASRISEQFRNHTTKKIYHARVAGVPQNKKGTLKNYLRKNEQNLKAEVFDIPTPGADEAILDYELVSSNSKSSILKISLRTGRFHQIRAQLAHIGHPILGDIKYGSLEKYSDQHIDLCATALTFDLATADMAHPETTRRTVVAPFNF